MPRGCPCERSLVKLPAEPAAKLARMIRFSGKEPTARRLHSTVTTIELALVRGVRKAVAARLVDALAAVTDA